MHAQMKINNLSQKHKIKTVEEKINTRNVYDLNQRNNGLAWKPES